MKGAHGPCYLLVSVKSIDASHAPLNSGQFCAITERPPCPPSPTSTSSGANGTPLCYQDLSEVAELLQVSLHSTEKGFLSSHKDELIILEYHQESTAMPDDEAQSVSPDSSGGGEEGHSILTLEFVNMNASTKAERQRNQKVIRSTAMKNFRRRQRSQREQAKEASTTVTEAHHQLLSQQTSANDTSKKNNGKESESSGSPTIEAKTEQDSDSVSSREVRDWISKMAVTETRSESQDVCSDYNDGDETVQAVQAESSLSYPAANKSSFVGSPMTLLGGGRIDPFRIYPSDYMGPQVNELIDHCES